ncbi:MAG TPA: IclR family transcriptional regulator [Polyangiales bacterium]|nr:IclR family transcriptional regulator [Polyangiales bacterium]
MSVSVAQATEGAVARAFSVLEYLALAREPARLSAVALALGLQKSTVHRILATLAGLGYVEQVQETGCYRTTLKLWELGASLIFDHPVKRAGAAFMQELHRTTGQTVSLTVLSGDDVLYLDKIMSPRAIRFTTRVGSRVPAPLTAGGKAMLAHAPDARAIVKRAAAQIKPERRIDVEAVLRELSEIRTLGYAISSFSPGVISIGAPVMARNGQAAAALSVSAPVERITSKKKAEIIESVLTTCAAMAERAGL